MPVGSLEDALLLTEGIDGVYGEGCLVDVMWEQKWKCDRWNPERLAGFCIGLGRLSDGAKQVVRLCLDCPHDLVEVVMSKRAENYLTCQDLRSYLRFNGWKYEDIGSAFVEIKNFLNTL